jgi:thiol-disulfide isomerase/thioredoxin
MLLELDMRLHLILVAFASVVGLGSCDRASPPPEQAEGAPTQVAAEKAALSNETLESASGMTAFLNRDYAGEQAPDAAFTGADGRDVRLSDFSGRPLLVNIWATWCAPCKAEMPTLDALAAIESGKLSVIAISQDLQGRQPVNAFFAKIGIENLEGYTDKPNRLSKAFDNQLKLPTTILYDSQGREVWRVEGGVEWNDEAITALLQEAN